MKEKVLCAIYHCFADWSAKQCFVCAPGCSTCCTTSVTITALEGRRILQYCQHNGLLEKVAEQLAQSPSTPVPEQTTNEFVLSVLNENKTPASQEFTNQKCIFLADDHCTIYPVRPFSCRCFGSTSLCKNDNVATVPDSYLYGSIAAMQIVEHLGQIESWGYLGDILLEQAIIHKEEAITAQLTDLMSMNQLRPRLRKAQPLPGFIVPEDFDQEIQPFLGSIFTTVIDGRTVEHILNGG